MGELIFQDLGDGRFSVRVDEQGSDVVIITPQPDMPQGAGEESEDMPDNIESQGQDGQDGDGQNSDQGGDQGGDQDGDQGGDQDGDQGGDQGGDQDGDQDGDGQESAGEEGQGQDSNGQSGEGEGQDRGEGEGEFTRGESDEFGDDFDEGFSEEELIMAIKQVEEEMEQERQREQSGNDTREDDERAVAEALSTTVEAMPSVFGSERIAKIALGGTKIFNVNNEARINNASKSIFSK